MTGTEDLLRRLAASDERALQAVLEPGCRSAPALDRVARALVQLAALLAADAVTTSLRWAVDAAWAVGVDDATLAQVLLAIAPFAGSVQTAASAPRLALALDVDLDEMGRELSPRQPSRPASIACATASERDATPSLR
jgi:alkylhydroperoxidase/carboxymuconolactone decarboxylase family protein YurZ